MELVEKLIEYVGIQVEEQTLFGPVHIKSMISVAILTLILCFGFHSICDGGYRLLIGLMSLVMILGESIKLIFPGLSIVDGAYIYTFNWVDMPFQLCSTPMYVMPLVALLPNGKLRDACIAYTMTLSLIGGLAVYATPDTVLGTNYYTNMQTMIHHGLQIVAGIYTAVYARSRINKRFFLGAVALFAVMIGIATVFNTVGYDHLVEYGKITEGSTFNMFYISPRADQTVPVLNDFLKSFHPAVYILGYFVALSLISLVIMLLTVALRKAFSRGARLEREV